MRKYLGSKMTAFAAIAVPFFVVVPIIFAVIMLSSEVSFATFFIALVCVSCTIVWYLYICQISKQLYSWGTFDERGIQIKTGISKKCVIEYVKCKSVGIGLYTHGILNSNIGSKVFFIFFSYEPFSENYRFSINLWKPSATRVKVEFDMELYNFLLTVLPKHQVRLLKRDYEKYIQYIEKHNMPTPKA